MNIRADVSDGPAVVIATMTPGEALSLASTIERGAGMFTGTAPALRQAAVEADVCQACIRNPGYANDDWGNDDPCPGCNGTRRPQHE